MAPRQFSIAAKTFTIREARVEEIVPLRHRMLRQGLPIDEAHFEGDADLTTRHFAVFDGDRAVGCASFMLNQCEGDPAWQLRGMATETGLQRGGLGGALLAYAVGAVRESSQVHLCWCNARVPAVEFYRKQGWKVVSEQFEIPTAGPHFKMVLTGIRQPR
jgi:predicted GNAT family N-acyltransferase